MMHYFSAYFFLPKIELFLQCFLVEFCLTNQKVFLTVFQSSCASFYKTSVVQVLISCSKPLVASSEKSEAPASDADIHESCRHSI